MDSLIGFCLTFLRLVRKNDCFIMLFSEIRNDYIEVSVKVCIVLIRILKVKEIFNFFNEELTIRLKNII